jgi:hypothetical protein
MSDTEGDTYIIPGADVLQHVEYQAHGDVPYGWHIWVMRDLESLQRVAASANLHTHSYAFSTLYDEPDDGGFIGQIYLAADWVYVGMVAHEAVHLASWMLKVRDGQTALGDTGDEAEALAEVTGTLTSVVWYNLVADGFASDDTEPVRDPHRYFTLGKRLLQGVVLVGLCALMLALGAKAAG